MNFYDKKKLINDINKFSSEIHEQIFELILQNYPDIKYNSNNQYTFIDLNTIDDEIFQKINQFVNLCKENVKYNKEFDFLYEKAQENMHDIYTDDYDLGNFSKPKNSIKIDNNSNKS